jgi:hypothetical protein
VSLDTYAGLLASVAGWLMRDDLTAVIPDFVALAEADMNAKLRLRAMLTTDTVDVEGGALPDDCLQVKSVGLSGYEDLAFGTPSEAVAHSLAYVGDTATRWSIDGNSLVVSPTQTGGGTVTLRYYARIPALSDANTTNHVLTASPGIYLYGSLLQAAPYLLDDARLATWGMLYDKTLDALQASDDAAEYPGPLVIRASQW